MDSTFFPNKFVKDGGKDRLIFNAAKQPTMDSTSFNMAQFSQSTEVLCMFSNVYLKVLMCLWNFQLSFPLTDIFMHENDVKSWFHQFSHHPYVMNTISFIIYSSSSYNVASCLNPTSVQQIVILSSRSLNNWPLHISITPLFCRSARITVISSSTIIWKLAP